MSLHPLPQTVLTAHKLREEAKRLMPLAAHTVNQLKAEAINEIERTVALYLKDR